MIKRGACRHPCGMRIVPPRHRIAWRLALCVATTGCLGSLEAPSEPWRPDEPSSFAATRCNEGDVPEAELLRINRRTYLAALEEVFGEDSVAAVAPSLDTLPLTRAGQYSSELEAPSFAVVSAYLDIASALAFEVSRDETTLGALRPCLAELSGPVDPRSNACLGGLVDDLGRRLTRRPLDDEDRARFLDAYRTGGDESVNDGVATLLMEMLLDPRFLYFLEVDGDEVSPGVARLTSHELAARLARTMWSSIPDDELMAAADAGLEGELLEEQVARMWADPRARDGMRRFYGEWLELPNDGSAADRETLAFAEALTFDRDATFADLLLDRTAFIEDDVTAAAYGLPEGTRGEVSLDPDRRAGLLTRVAWLSTIDIPHTNAGHLIKRGNRLSRVLCEPLPAPDPNVFPAEDPAAPTSTPVGIRERFQDATSDPICVHCHERLDAFGAPFGHYGSDGSWIDVEQLEQPDESVVEAPIDPVATVTLDRVEVTVTSAVEMSESLASSDQVAACFASHVTESMLGRELRAGDGCLVTDARDVLASPDADPGTVRAALFAILTSPSFSMRRLPEVE